MSARSVEVSGDGAEYIGVSEDLSGMTVSIGSVSIVMSTEQASEVWRQLNDWFGIESRQLPSIDTAQAHSEIMEAISPFLKKPSLELASRAVAFAVGSIASRAEPAEYAEGGHA